MEKVIPVFGLISGNEGQKRELAGLAQKRGKWIYSEKKIESLRCL